MRKIDKFIKQIKCLDRKIEVAVNGWKYQIFTKNGSEDFRLSKLQQRLHETPHRKNIILKSRQLGVTSYCVLAAIHTILFKPGRVSLIVCPSESQVSTIRGYIDQILSQSLLNITYKNKVLQIENSGKIVFTNSNTDSCRGLACDYIYITEGQDYNDVGKVLESVLPTISTRPKAKIFIDGTMPEKADSSFLQLFGDVVDFIPDARIENIIDFDGLWILFNSDISREDVGSAYDREVLLELPLTGTECKVEVTNEQPTNCVYKLIFEYRSCTYLAEYFGNGLLTVVDNVTISQIKELILSNKYTTFVAEGVHKSLPTKVKELANAVGSDLGNAIDNSSMIKTNKQATFYLDGGSGLAKTEISGAALFLNKVLSNEQ
jgi:hypothetical protein